MPVMDSRVTVHMAASLDGFVARRDGNVDWLETTDEYAAGEEFDPEYVESFLASIDCYVMGSGTYEVAARFDAQGYGWPYGDKPTFVLTSRHLPRIRETIVFHNGDPAALINEDLRPNYRSIWIAGGASAAGTCLRLGVVDVVRVSILPILIGDGVRLFEGLDHDVALHLTEVKAYRSGMAELAYEVKRARES